MDGPLNHRTPSLLAAAGVMLAAVLCFASAGCAGSGEELVSPELLSSPYDTARGEPLWAVAPLRNESGSTSVDPLAVSDVLVAKVQEVRGISCIPMNRTIAGMRALGMRSVGSPLEAQQLARVLGVDAIVVGTITAYDPYEPPKLGLTIGLYGMAAPDAEQVALDVRELAANPRDAGGAAVTLQRPLAVISSHFDAQNHATLLRIKQFAAGRTDHRAPLGWRSFVANMDLFTDFAAQEVLRDLLTEESARVSRANAARKSENSRKPAHIGPATVR